MSASEAEIVTKLVGALDAIPSSSARITMESLPGATNYDAQVETVLAGRQMTLMVEAKRAVYPRDALQYLYQIRRWTDRAKELAPKPFIVPMLAAHSISRSAKELLRKNCVAHFDSGGSLFISAENILIDIERPPPPSEKRAIRSLFTGTRARVLLTLLVQHGDWINVKDLSADAKVSAATASEVLQELERNDWVDAAGAGPAKQRKLNRPKELLDSWAQFVRTDKSPKLRRYYIPNAGSPQFAERVAQCLERHRIDYAMTGEAAAQHYSPYLTHISQLRCRLTFSGDVEKALTALGAKPAHEGTNLSILETGSTGGLLHRNNEEGIWYAHPIQVYLDLLAMEGRAGDMAEHLRQTRIAF